MGTQSSSAGSLADRADADKIVFVLRDTSSGVTEALRREFAAYADGVEVSTGSMFNAVGDAVVCPGNSFGFMDGVGVDLECLQRFGSGPVSEIQEKIRTDHDGELLVGDTLMVPTGSAQLPWFIAAPLWRVPSGLAGLPNVYLAFRGVIRAVLGHNKGATGPKIRRVLCPGMGTALGCIAIEDCVLQMRRAYETTYLKLPQQAAFPASLADAMLSHQRLVRSPPGHWVPTSALGVAAQNGVQSAPIAIGGAEGVSVGMPLRAAVVGSPVESDDLPAKGKKARRMRQARLVMAEMQRQAAASRQASPPKPWYQRIASGAEPQTLDHRP
mmetsp:Transcript_48550/g.155309  ORF Transcript_48550/g.155309 Transcript_48550/m.155309 type:complete len:327 (+) Transcript_48550:331-1311(+)